MSDVHELLDEVLWWAEQFAATDPMKVQQLRDPLNTVHMVIDQLVERSANADRPTSTL